ncbi:MAG: hypothetical protein KDD42_08230 [Bdellovibrionales bacterium]|nr:hypothetical protein [Bdellovibrionales bacterium]
MIKRQAETELLFEDSDETPYPYCKLPPHFFERLLAKHKQERLSKLLKSNSKLLPPGEISYLNLRGRR